MFKYTDETTYEYDEEVDGRKLERRMAVGGVSVPSAKAHPYWKAMQSATQLYRGMQEFVGSGDAR